MFVVSLFAKFLELRDGMFPLPEEVVSDRLLMVF